MISVKNGFKGNWANVALLIFVASIPTLSIYSVKIMILLLVVSFFLPANGSLKKLFLSAWACLLYFGILILGLLQTDHLNTGLSVLETNFSFIAIPIIFFKVKKSGFRLEDVLYSFVVGIGLACLICLTTACYKYSQNGEAKVFLYYQFTEVLDFQPTYFAYFISFAISVLLYFIHYNKNKFSTWLHLILIIFLFVPLMLTAGRTAYVAMLFVFAFYILKFLCDDKRNFNSTFTFRTSSLLLISMLLINYLDINANYNLSENNNDYWERLELWKSGLLANTDFLFGVGTGDYKTALNDYFLKHGYINYAKENYNAHNQFIQTFLSNGLLGVLSLLLLMGWPLYLSVKYQNVLGIM